MSITDADKDSLCKDYVYSFAMQNAINTLSSFIIVIVNVLLKTLLMYLGKFEKYKTLSEEISKTIMKIFLALFINTSLVILVLNGEIFGFKASYLSGLFGLSTDNAQNGL